MTSNRPQPTSPTTSRRAIRSSAMVLPLLCACLFLTACAPNPAPQILPPPPSLTESRIAESGQRIARAVEQLQRDQAAVTADAGRQPAPPIDPMAAPAALRMAVTWNDWSGPIEKAVRGVAERIRYHVHVNGVPPAGLPIIHIDVTNVPAIQVLEDIGLQAGSRATVRLDAGSTTINIYYAPPKMGLM